MFCGTSTALPSRPPLYYCRSCRTPLSSRPFLRQELSRRTNIDFISRVSSFADVSKFISRASSLKQVPMAVSEKEVGQTIIDPEMVDDYTSQAKLLQEFTNISTVSKAWMFDSNSGSGSQAMFSIGQVNLMDNSKRTSLLSSYVTKDTDHSVTFHWSPFPVEMIGVSTMVPSPSGSKLLIVRNKDNNAPTKLEIWSFSKLVKEIQIPKSVHGSIFTDEFFEGISWNSEENYIAYIAEEPLPLRPTFDYLGYKKESNFDKDPEIWKAQGDWEEHWGETYVGKRRPTLFVVDIESGDVRIVEGIPNSLSLGQVVWAPVSSSDNSKTYLVFVGWKSEDCEQKPSRKLGIKYCYNRPCSLYAIGSPFQVIISGAHDDTVGNDSTDVINLTPTLGSAFFPRFSPDGKSLVFLSAKTSVDTGAHSATNSLHRIDWTESEISCSPINIHDIVPVVMYSEDGTFPGLYCPNILSNPWLSDGSTMILCSYWGSTQVILSINVLSCKVTQVTPIDSKHSWGFLALNGDDILAVSSSPVDLPQLKYGCFVKSDEKPNQTCSWDWQDVPNPLHGCSEKVHLLLSSLKFDIMKIPICNDSANVTEGSRKAYEAIFVSSSDSQTKQQSKVCSGHGACNPLIVILHGGPHSVSLTSYSKNQAFLAALGYNLLIINYRGSLGFGEEALQSLPGKIGTQDVNDVLSAMDKIIEMGLADPSKIAVLGGSHGGFLTAHLIGQAPDRFKVAALRNPVCNLSLMVGTSDIPDWCYFETFGTSGQYFFTESPSAEHLNYFLTKSPISHLHKVKTPALFLLGAQDLRVPVSNGLQYARALKEKGGDVKVIVFPNDTHAIDRPQSDFESFLNIGIWFKKHF